MKALVVNDLDEIQQMIGARLEQQGFELCFAGDGRSAWAAFERLNPQVIVTHALDEPRGGIEFVSRVREISKVPVVVLAAPASIPDCERAMRLGADRYLQLGVDLDRIGEVVARLVGESPSTPGTPDTNLVTADEARSRARSELARRLQELVVECDGNIAEMGRRLGKDRSTVRYHLRRLGMLEKHETSADSRACEGFVFDSVSRAQRRMPDIGADTSQSPDRN